MNRSDPREGVRTEEVPLLKTIVAEAGDSVEFSSRGLYVNGIPVPNTAPKPQDTGRPLRHWPFGRYEVAPGTVWVASSFNSRSFDSRNFGLVLAKGPSNTAWMRYGPNDNPHRKSRQPLQEFQFAKIEVAGSTAHTRSFRTCIKREFGRLSRIAIDLTRS